MNLENLDLVELTTQEVVEVDGGIDIDGWYAIRTAGHFIGGFVSGFLDGLHD